MENGILRLWIVLPDRPRGAWGTRQLVSRAHLEERGLVTFQQGSVLNHAPFLDADLSGATSRPPQNRSRHRTGPLRAGAGWGAPLGR